MLNWEQWRGHKGTLLDDKNVLYLVLGVDGMYVQLSVFIEWNI